MATTVNPLSVLEDIIPARARKYVYAVVALLALGYGIYQAADGDWKQFIALLIGSIVSTVATANTHPEDAQYEEQPDFEETHPLEAE